MDYFSGTFTTTSGTPVLLVDASTIERLVTFGTLTNNIPYTTVGFTSTTLIGLFELRPFVLPAGLQLWADGHTGNTVQVFVSKSTTHSATEITYS